MIKPFPGFLISTFLFCIAMLLSVLAEAKTAGFLKAEGRQLLLDGRNYRFEAICFSNNYNDEQLNLLTSKHHNEADFERVKALGFNSIRFAFNGNWFTNDRSGFWTWLDQNIEWAREHELRLILDLHVPVGSFWLDPTSPKVSFAIWDDPHVRQQNIDLWKAISARYKHEPVIAAYDIVNEPVTTDQDGGQWKQLARQVVDVIRSNGDNHLIVIERLYGVNKKYGARGIASQFLVDDDNILYDFHFYEPIHYTHQNARWLENPIGNGGRYPDKSQLTPTGNQVLNVEARISSQTVRPGTTAWQKYSSGKIKVTAPGVVAAMPHMTVRGAASGTVYFDDIEVFEYDAQGKLIGKIWEEPLNTDSIWQWWEWQRNNNGQPDAFKGIRARQSGYQDEYSLGVQLKNTTDATLAGWSSHNYWLAITPGHSYEITGKMRSEKLSYHNRRKPAFIGFELDVFEDSSEGKPAVLPRDIRYLKREFMRFYQFGLDHDVPMSVLETGLISEVLTDREKGGDRWVEDLLGLFKIKNTSYAYWNYHGDQMGIFMTKPKEMIGNPNYPLIDALVKQQNGNKERALTGLGPAKQQALKPLPENAYMQPPGGLKPKQVPQFVVIGFDDNTLAKGMDWAADLFANKLNPGGKGNKATFDGSAARVSFYMNTLGLQDKGMDKPERLKQSLRRLYEDGHEIGNHTHNHHADINWMPWNRFQNVLSRMTRAAWRQRIQQCQIDLNSLAGLPKAEMTGFRAPYLSYNQAMLDTLARQGFNYDCSIEEGYAPKFDGRNFRWPYPMDNGAPGHGESWRGNRLNPDYVVLQNTPGIWQLPNHVLMVPDDKTARKYQIEPGLWQRIKKHLPFAENHRITGFDYNLWTKAALNKQEVFGLLKYNLDLRLEGNRAPFMFGGHTEYYVDPQWAKRHAPNASMIEMQQAIAEFVDYALSKPMVRIRPARDIIAWVKNPVAL